MDCAAQATRSPAALPHNTLRTCKASFLPRGNTTAGPAAFMLGNEGQGLSPKQMALCDKFVYIPQVSQHVHGEHIV